MFKKSRRKIIAVILLVLALLLSGTLCVIYLASYVNMTRENNMLLEQYTEEYTLRDVTEITSLREEKPEASSGRRRPEPPMLELSTFYSVAFSDDGQILKVDTADITSLDGDALTVLAREILESGKDRGTRNRLTYRVTDKGTYTLVAFLDNSVILENAASLISYTLIFGGAAFIPLFFLARWLAGRIVGPLEDSYRRQKQFISDAGHELKTPVAVVSANLELLSRETGENQWLSNIRYENERMSALISQLLELARTENTVPPMEPLDFSHLVYGEVLPFETVAYENNLVLEMDIIENLTVSGNSTQLKQLTSILTDNAIRHCSGGSNVSLTLKKEKNSVLLSVQNDGDPIPPEQRAHIFERFYRTDQARADEGGHYGLGLAIAKAIVTAHRGTIEVHCQDGRVEFAVKLPLYSAGRKI